MIRKTSLFFTTPIRKKMKDARFTNQPGFRKAIRLPSEVLDATFPEPYTEDTSKAKIIGGQMWELFCVGHHQHTELKRAASIAQRVESTISFFQGVTADLQLEVAFYLKGDKEPFFVPRFGVKLDSAEIIAIGNGNSIRHDWFWDRELLLKHS